MSQGAHREVPVAQLQAPCYCPQFISEAYLLYLGLLHGCIGLWVHFRLFPSYYNALNLSFWVGLSPMAGSFRLLVLRLRNRMPGCISALAFRSLY